MELDIHAGKRILYKFNGKWNVGELAQASAYVDKGLFLPVIKKKDLYKNLEHIMVEINDIFLEAEPVEDWMRTYEYIMTKEEYMDFIESEDFERSTESSYVSDGEYYYYPVSKFTRNWLMKQPFDYIVRSDNG